jgi:hypothetical protein
VRRSRRRSSAGRVCSRIRVLRDPRGPSSLAARGAPVYGAPQAHLHVWGIGLYDEVPKWPLTICPGMRSIAVWLNGTGDPKPADRIQSWLTGQSAGAGCCWRFVGRGLRPRPQRSVDIPLRDQPPKPHWADPFHSIHGETGPAGGVARLGPASRGFPTRGRAGPILARRAFAPASDR